MTACPNQSAEEEFYILAFTASPVGQFSIFLGVLLMYLLTILGNLTIIILVYVTPDLHTPMYFFLFNLSLVDVASSSTYIPKLLMITLTQDHKISFDGCMIQLFFNLLCAGGDNFILTSMSYDRYLAICKPLQYYLIMSEKRCASMAASCWMIAAFNSLMLSLLISVLLFCKSRDIDNFFCDLNTMISLSSSDTKSRKILLLFEDIVFGFILFALIITSYGFIFSNIVKIHSRDGRLKAFSTCVSHLITVILFYVPSIFLYLKQESEHTTEQDKLLSMLYLVVVPMLNPLVYSLRNKDIWKAFSKVKMARRKILRH
ncbi:PREDICTED: olfactory receptor 1F1-like [Nanorana parkeri]|uniref:olfactory receptor 1F1-like n=1 Tax=Nanorana parkeri TaxID=125878 RepID=UPI00085477C5|nr:PREDICTED: olfactory receptor 1F1-like [Nanorana parkeri]